MYADVTTTDSGLQFEVLRDGEGDPPISGQTVTIHYRGTLPSGDEFDSSYDGDPATFPVDGVIPGFSEALRDLATAIHRQSALIFDNLGCVIHGPRRAMTATEFRSAQMAIKALQAGAASWSNPGTIGFYLGDPGAG